MAIRIVLADDHRMFLEGLSSMLNEHPEMEVIGEAHDGASAINLALELKPDLVIMDVSMPGINGIEATSKILQVAPEIKIIALSTYLKKSFVTEMLKAGASGYILKEQAFDELVDAILVIIKGEKYLSSKVASILVDDYIQIKDKPFKNMNTSLTGREVEVLKSLAEGLTTKEIALQSDVSIQSVDTIRRRLMSKLEIDNFADLIKYAIRQGLTTFNE